ncbi:uncharacterized protein ACOB8E_006405 isoform 2-T31 [Sarcophilus harrisii]
MGLRPRQQPSQASLMLWVLQGAFGPNFSREFLLKAFYFIRSRLYVTLVDGVQLSVSGNQTTGVSGFSLALVKTGSHWWMGSKCQSMGTRQQQSQASLMLWHFILLGENFVTLVDGFENQAAAVSGFTYALGSAVGIWPQFLQGIPLKKVKTVSHWWMGSNCQSMGTRQQQSQASLMLWYFILLGEHCVTLVDVFETQAAAVFRLHLCSGFWPQFLQGIPYKRSRLYVTLVDGVQLSVSGNQAIGVSGFSLALHFISLGEDWVTLVDGIEMPVHGNQAAAVSGFPYALAFYFIR